METYFNIRYEFDRSEVGKAIAVSVASKTPGYICVADGVVLNHVNEDEKYRQVVDGAMFSICDSSYVPLYLKWIYGIKRRQYCGSDIFMDIVKSGKYRMFFMGASQEILDALKSNLVKMDSRISSMVFYELPFCSVDEFDYPAIADMIDEDGADIIWVALGAPKQEIFMNRLVPHLSKGVMIAVGAVFKFFSGLEARRAPEWMVKMHLEFVYRIFSEPKKQIKRCWGIVSTLPRLLYEEKKRAME